MGRRFALWGVWLAVGGLALAVSTWVRPRLRPRLAPDPLAVAQAKHVRILRDKWGMPHIFGDTDADTAFGLAYAQAEDNWRMGELSLAAARGRLGLVKPSLDALKNDYLVAALGIAREVDAEYERQLSPEFRAVLEAYARGATYFAALHPDKADPRILPITGKDIAAGFLHKLPLFMGLADALQAIDEPDEPPRHGGLVGSNAHAVHASRSADGVARLNVNSHQPWEGPVAWYEAQLVSGEGWNMTGGTFPGAPMILHGHNETLGWAHTVNRPPLVRTYRLQMDPSGAPRYRLDGKWEPLERERAWLTLDLGPFDVSIPKTVSRSRHGMVLESRGRYFAFRFAGVGRLLGAADQWYRMNKARNFDEWRAAMRRQGLPMFNTVYADAQHIFYVYNALLPKLPPGTPPREVLDGSRGDLVFTEYPGFDELPAVLDPPAGFVQNANSTPFATTAGEGNPRAEAFAPELGIETRLTNRAVRSLELFGAGEPVTRGLFRRWKFDRRYSKASPLYRDVIAPLLVTHVPKGPGERVALERLRTWDGDAEETSPAVAIFTLLPIATAREFGGRLKEPKPAEALAGAVAFLEKHFGRVDVALGDVQRLRRGSVDLPLGGGPDVLGATYSSAAGGRYVGHTGDSYVLLVEFPSGAPARSWSINPYGASADPRSPHYADQAPLFVRRELRPSLRTEAEIRGALEREYHPGE